MTGISADDKKFLISVGKTPQEVYTKTFADKNWAGDTLFYDIGAIKVRFGDDWQQKLENEGFEVNHNPETTNGVQIRGINSIRSVEQVEELRNAVTNQKAK